MRTDLSANFVTKMAAASRSPRQLIVFNFPVAGTIRISDQALGTADGLDNEYQSLVVDWGALEDIASGDPKDHQSGEVRKLSLTLWNGGASPFSDYFLEEDPENVTVDLYQWFTGLTESESALLDTFVIQDPIAFDENSNRLVLDLVSLSMRYDQPVGDVVSLDDWPNAAESAVGKSIDVIVGEPGAVALIPAKVPAAATLKSSILSDDLLIHANENLTTRGFSATGGTLQIDQEKIIYSSHDGTYFTVSQRGALGTQADEHISTHEIIEHITDHTYLIGRGPVNSISDILVDGFPNKAAYAANLTANPARVVFSEPPFSERFADSPTFKSLQFDEVAADNTALQPHYALDPEDGEGATINETNRLLSIIQRDANQNVGEIHKCFLGVEYFAGPRAFTSDSVSVALNGSGLGNLPRPNTQGQVVIDAEVDIDHGHNHSISGEHTHPFSDPALALTDPAHGHNTSGGPIPAEYVPSGSVPYTATVYGPLTPGNWALSRTTLGLGKTFYGLPDTWESSFLTISYDCYFSQYVVEVIVNGTVLTGRNIEHTIYLGAGSGGYKSIDIRARSIASGDTTVTITAMKLNVTSGVSVQAGGSGVQVDYSRSGENAVKSDKDVADVEALATDNIPVAITSSEPTTQSFTKLFDITSTVNFDWAAFYNMAVKLQYNGSVDNESVYILNVFFDIEYRKKELSFNGLVTADVSGAIDDAAGSASGTSNGLIQNPVHVVRYLLGTVAGMPSSYQDAAGTQASAITELDSLGYTLDGVINGDMTVRDAVKACARQSRTRFWWNGGKLRAKVRQKIADLSAQRALVPEDFRLKSFSAERQAVTTLQNRIRLAYAKNHSSEVGGLADFKKLSTGSSLTSINDNGILEDRESFLFNLVKNDDMAADLLAFYIENLSTASTFYTFETYLNNFDLEKEDCVTLTSASFGKLLGALAVIRSIDRRFGSGKNRTINSLRIVAEVLYYIRLTLALNDSVTVSDIIQVALDTFDLNISDVVAALDELVVGLDISTQSEVSVSDVVSVINNYVSTLADSVTVTEAATFEDSATISDAVTAADSVNILLVNGYGSGPYGGVTYGGEAPLVTQSIGDVIAVLDALGISSGISVSDSVSITDEIYFSVGGLGVTPFGEGGFGG